MESLERLDLYSADVTGRLPPKLGNLKNLRWIDLSYNVLEGSSLSATQRTEVTVEAPNRAPEPVGTIPGQSLTPGQWVSISLSSYFRDPEGGTLSFSASTSSAAVADVSVSGDVVTITHAGTGTAIVNAVARDPRWSFRTTEHYGRRGFRSGDTRPRTTRGRAARAGPTRARAARAHATPAGAARRTHRGRGRGQCAEYRRSPTTRPLPSTAAGRLRGVDRVYPCPGSAVVTLTFFRTSRPSSAHGTTSRFRSPLKVMRGSGLRRRP